MTDRSFTPPEESAEDLYENAPFGYISFLTDGTIFKINKTLLDLLGYQREEILQVKKIQSLFKIGGKIYFETHFFPLIRMQGFVKEINFDLVKKDGSFFPALLNVDQITSEKTKTSSYRASVIDITDRKKYEKVLMESKDKAEKASRAKAEFLSTISHEIRTPLNAIVGIGNLMNQTTLNDLQKEYARILQLSSENLLELVNNLLDLSKLEAQKVKLEERTFNIKDLLKVLILSFEIKAAEKNIELKTDFPEDLPNHLIGDPIKLNQVLTNLLGNAIKFTREGYVKLGIQVRESDKKNVVLHFTIRDSGIGIPKEKLDIIFQEFSQASYDVNLEYGGTGLGLTISQKLLQIQGSELFVESEYGKGSEFSFILKYKISSKSSSKDNRPTVEDKIKKSGAKILVVDDSHVNLFITSQYLAGWNLPHTTVESGSAAINAAKQQHYDIILMDLHMPKMNGYETSKRIHALESEVKPVIIALSASGRGDINLKMERAGISAYVPKPFDPAELQEVIIRFLSENPEEKPKSSLKESSRVGVANPALISEGSIGSSRLLSLSKKDPQILKKLISNSLKSIKNFEDEFTSAANDSDHIKIGKLIHKNTMTLHYIEAEKLGELVKNFRLILRNPEIDNKELSKKKMEVMTEFQNVITGLTNLKK